MKQQLLNYGTQIKKWKSRIKIFLFILFLSSTVNSSAQLISTYTFTTATGTTADAMASPTVGLIFSNNDDSVSALTTFSALTSGAGFTFLFDGTAYTTFSVSSNGLLQLGTRIPSVDSTNLLASASFNPKITAYWDNLHTGTIAGGGKVHCKFIGSSPSRKLVIEWFETVPRNAAAAANAKFQVWLFESTHATTPNLIQLVYGSGLVVNGTNGGYSIGLANSATDFWSVTSSSNTASSVTANFANTTAITSGRSYTFTPPAKPACAAGLVPANLAIVPTNSSVSWGGVTGATGYDVYFGTASTPPLMVTNQSGVSYTPVGMTDNTQYFWRIAPRNAGGPITTCSTISFTALNVPPCATNFAPANGTTGVYALTPTILSWATGGGVVTGYDVYLDTLASPVKLVSGNQAGTTYDPVTLLANRTYYWKIIPRNSSGPATGCTVTSFTTLATPTTCGSSFTPVNGTTGVPALTPTKLSWVRASGIVTDYDVYLDTTTPPVNIVSNNQPDTTFNPSALLPNKLYYWRVIPRKRSD